MPENALAALTQVAAAAAMTLVAAMVSDAWREVRERVAGLLSRGDRGREALQQQLLEESRHRIISAAPDQCAAIRAAEQDRWEAALRLALVLDDRLALDLAILADDLAMLAAPTSMDQHTARRVHMVHPQRVGQQLGQRIGQRADEWASERRDVRP